MELSDEAIVERVCAGEIQLFELLMRRHNQRVYRTVRAVLGREDEAEDAMQQAYLQAFQHLAQFHGAAKFSTWLTRIAVNEAIARTRRSHAYLSEDAIVQKASDSETPEESAARHELGRLLERAIDALPEIYRTALMLRDVEGLSGAEVAQALDVSEDVVKQRLVRGRAMLESRLLADTRDRMGQAFAFPATRCDRVVTNVMDRLTT